MKRDEKNINFYKMELENDNLLKEKIILRRQITFKELLEYNLKKIEINLMKKKEKLKKLKMI